MLKTGVSSPKHGTFEDTWIDAMADQGPGSVRRVTVVGGGFTGAIFAHHLLRTSRHAVAIDIVEERSRLGAGLAYSAAAAHQTTNIPVARMSIYPDDRRHFERWLTGRDGGPDAVEPYPNRALFGAYMDELVRASVPLHPQSRLRHLRTRVTAVARHHEGLVVHTADERAQDTDAVVLATGNPTPAPPAFLTTLAHDARVIHDPWHPGTLKGIQPDDRLLILGVGLTMGEVVAGLKADGEAPSRPSRVAAAAPSAAWSLFPTRSAISRRLYAQAPLLSCDTFEPRSARPSWPACCGDRWRRRRARGVGRSGGDCPMGSGDASPGICDPIGKHCVM